MWKTGNTQSSPGKPSHYSLDTAAACPENSGAAKLRYHEALRNLMAPCGP